MLTKIKTETATLTLTIVQARLVLKETLEHKEILELMVLTELTV